MAKIIFEFKRDYSGADSENVNWLEGIGINITVSEISAEEESGPQDALAYIVAAMGSSIIDNAGKRLLKEMKENGMDACCTRYRPQQH